MSMILNRSVNWLIRWLEIGEGWGTSAKAITANGEEPPEIDEDPIPQPCSPGGNTMVIDEDPIPQPCSPGGNTMVEETTIQGLLAQVAEYQPAKRVVLHNVELSSARELISDAQEVTSILMGLRSGKRAR